MFDDTESDYSHNSDSDDFDRVITRNISIEVDQFIRYLGNRSSPNYSGPGEVKFMQVGNKCKTNRGTFPFGEKASAKRVSCRALYDRYKKKAGRGFPAIVPESYDPYSFLEQTEESDKLLFGVPIVHPTHQPVSPIRTIPIPLKSSTPHRQNTRSPIRNLSRSPIRNPSHSPFRKLNRTQKKTTPPQTMSSKNEKGKEPGVTEKEREEWSKLVKLNNVFAIGFDTMDQNPTGTLCTYQPSVETEPNSKLYRDKITIAIQIDHPSLAKLSKPRLLADQSPGFKMLCPILPTMLTADPKQFIDQTERILTADLNRKTEIDVMLGSGKYLDRSDVAVGTQVIKGVPFVEKTFMFPPGVFGSNEFFNDDAKQIGDPFVLVPRMVFIHDLNKKKPMDIIDELKRLAPVASTVLAGRTLANYNDAARALLKNVTGINTAFFVVFEIAVCSSERTGNKNDNLDVNDLVDDIAAFNLGT